ncbi:hypothetical protein QJS77_15205, partial [Enterococcus faecium]
LINSPQLILADEPTASLDYENGRLVMELLAKQAHEEGRRLVVITHDERMLDVCDRVLRVIDGTLTELTREKGITTNLMQLMSEPSSKANGNT